MFVSMEPDARNPWKGWNAKLVMLDLCPVRVFITVGDRKQQSNNHISFSCDSKYVNDALKHCPPVAYSLQPPCPRLVWIQTGNQWRSDPPTCWTGHTPPDSYDQSDSWDKSGHDSVRHWTLWSHDHLISPWCSWPCWQPTGSPCSPVPLWRAGGRSFSPTPNRKQCWSGPRTFLSINTGGDTVNAVFMVNRTRKSAQGLTQAPWYLGGVCSSHDGDTAGLQSRWLTTDIGLRWPTGVQPSDSKGQSVSNTSHTEAVRVSSTAVSVGEGQKVCVRAPEIVLILNEQQESTGGNGIAPLSGWRQMLEVQHQLFFNIRTHDLEGIKCFTVF